MLTGRILDMSLDELVHYSVREGFSRVQTSNPDIIQEKIQGIPDLDQLD